MVSLPPPMNGESLHREMQATLPKPVVATPLHLLTHTRALMHAHTRNSMWQRLEALEARTLYKLAPSIAKVSTA